MIPILDEILIGSSATALVTYLLAKFAAFGETHVQKTEYVFMVLTNHIWQISDDDNEMILISAKKTHNVC